MLSNFKVLALMIIFVSLSVTANVDRSLVNRLLKKAGKPVEWEDLGFAWGKRSSAPELYDVSPEKMYLQRPVRSLQADKKGNEPQWSDLGWAWGKK